MFKFAVYALWIVVPPLQGAIAFRMWRRKSHLEYPLFFAYTLEQLVRFVVLFYYYHLNVETPYRHFYAIFQAIEAILQIGIVCELFADVFGPYEGIRQIGPSLLRWASIFFLFSAIVVAAYSTSTDSSTFLSYMFAMDRSVEIVQAGLLLLLALASSFLGLEWNTRTLGIALGFGLFTSVNLITYTIWIQHGSANQRTLSLISNLAYDLAVVLWVRAFCFQSASPPEGHQQSVHWDVQSWNRALSGLLRR